MQTILGSGGAIGVELAKVLTSYTNSIRLVSRNPKKVNPTDELISADLLNKEDVFKAVEGSEVVYVTIGFEYKTKIWQSNWPKFIKYVIEACISNNSKLVFFDNIYMYDPRFISDMDEETPINPSSEKGKVRAEVVKLIMDAVNSGKLKALIARSADFYGPGIKETSMLNEMVIKPLKAGKKANWIGSADYKHGFTYTPDAAVATAMLGNLDESYNQVWHLPTSSEPLTGRDWINNVAVFFKVKPRVQVISKFLLRVTGLFMPVMKEIVEMTYQYEKDYVFKSDKFEQAFNFKPTSYAEGLKAVIKSDYSI